ncbi:DUF58 domain-containing protein [Candidatus Blastococcus massiliensis]|uniref:DUF58 domain-containing protein n=1 Tax=Candidatus Blastococcus massiliensis TaxID=1470358 RepID=UPI0004BBECE3|nr:DUF58 domain-containing protein [Candidatus Blastococcus massiliensis]
MPDPGRPRTALTRRGRRLLAGGAALLACGALLGERPVVQLAVFVLALPLVAAGVVTRERFRLAVRRTLPSARIPRGRSTDVLLDITGTGPRTGGVWLLTEQLPPTLGPDPRFTVTGLSAGRTTSLRYRITPARRGRYSVGPMRSLVMDPFGLVERTATGTGGAPLLVLPRVQSLGSAGPLEGNGSGDGSRRSAAVHGEDDVSIREYRRGDDLRKVHWRATARTGELKVRLEERPWRARATLLLDARAPAHLLARRDERAPDDSLEWAVEAAASIATALVRRGTEVRVVTESGELLGTGGGTPGTGGPEDLLDRLATLTPSPRTDLGLAVGTATRGSGEGQLVCLLGALGPVDVAHLVGARPGSSTDLAVLLDLGSWVSAVRGHRSGASAALTALAEQREEAAAQLRAAGWRVAVARAGDPVARVWAALAGSPSVPGTRAGR